MTPQGRSATLVLAAVLRIPAAAGQYQRQADVAPSPEDIGEGYVTPDVQCPLPRAEWLEVLDVALLTLALGLCAWLVLKRRSRGWVIALAAGCVAYFGFYREGCVCPIGAIQNVAVALTDPGYAVPYTLIVIFLLPLIVALFAGRVFCGGVCPLGAIQELVLLRPVHVPRRLDKLLGLLKYAYLLAAIWLAVQPLAQRDFVICRFDPFVGFFRRTGFAHMLIIGGVLLLIGTIVGRPYCRYLCPYGALLSWCTRLSRHGVTITAGKELDCGLCVDACPYGAIEQLRAVRPACLYCARCYRACPEQAAHARPGPALPRVESHTAAGT